MENKESGDETHKWNKEKLNKHFCQNTKFDINKNLKIIDFKNWFYQLLIFLEL